MNRLQWSRRRLQWVEMTALGQLMTGAGGKPSPQRDCRECRINWSVTSSGERLCTPLLSPPKKCRSSAWCVRSTMWKGRPGPYWPFFGRCVLKPCCRKHALWGRSASASPRRELDVQTLGFHVPEPPTMIRTGIQQDRQLSQMPIKISDPLLLDNIYLFYLVIQNIVYFSQVADGSMCQWKNDKKPKRSSCQNRYLPKNNSNFLISFIIVTDNSKDFILKFTLDE